MDRKDSDPGLRIAILFQEAYWKDREAGRTRSLGEYLDLFPQNRSVVIREYLAAEGAAEAPASDPALETGAPETETEDGIGPYRIIDEIGRGGQGIVYLAEDPRLGRRVALKVLATMSGMPSDAILRFQREASVASRIDHPGICAVFDVGRARGISYIAMRHVEGESLQRAIARARESGDSRVRVSERHDLAGILDLISRAARALHVAHETGIVHRDIKPGNIMVARDGQPVILDFGIAREDSPTAATLTKTGDIFGTPAYLAPEQLEPPPGGVDRRADVYALGVTLYECLTLRHPFEAPTREGLYRAILHGEPTDPRRHDEALSRDMAVCVKTALEKDRNRRYQTAAALADDLDAIQAGRLIAARPVGPAARFLRWAKREPAKASVAALLAVGLPVLAALTSYVYATRDSVVEAEKNRTLREVEGRLERGYFELGEGDPAASRALFEEVLTLDPDSIEAVAGLALAYREEDRYQAALAVIDLHARLAAHSPQLSRLRADILRALDGTGMPEAAPPLDATPIEAFLAGSRALMEVHRGNWQARAEALERFEWAILSSPHARALYTMQAMHAATHGDDVSAITRLSRALQNLWPDSIMTRFYAATALKYEGRLAEALPLLEALVRERPDFSLGRLSLAACLASLGRHADAAREFSAALALVPNSPTGRRGLGRALLKIDKPAAAVKELREAVRLAPNEPHYRASLAEALFAAGDVDGGIAQYRESLSRNPQLPWEIGHGFAARLDRAGRTQEAIAEYRKVIEIGPDYAPGWMKLGILLSRTGEDAEAERMFRRCVALRPDDHEAWRNLGIVCLRQGRVEEALVAATEAVRLHPDDGESRFVLGTIIEKRGDLALAANEYAAATRHSPDHARAWCNLGLRRMQLGQFEEALPALRKGHELGTRRPDWSYPSAKWVAECETLARRDAATLAVLRGESRPASLRAWVELAEFCHREKGALEELEILSRAMADTNDAEALLQLRIPAARAAARISGGSGAASRPAQADRQPETRALSEADRARWRRQGVAWLSEQLTSIESRVAADEMPLERGRTIAAKWLSDPGLAALREPASDPADEQARAAFWARVEPFVRGR